MRVINTYRQKNNVVETDTPDRIVSPEERSREEPEERAHDSNECRVKASRMSQKIRISKKSFSEVEQSGKVFNMLQI